MKGVLYVTKILNAFVLLSLISCTDKIESCTSDKIHVLSNTYWELYKEDFYELYSPELMSKLQYYSRESIVDGIQIIRIDKVNYPGHSRDWGNSIVYINSDNPPCFEYAFYTRNEACLQKVGEDIFCNDSQFNSEVANCGERSKFEREVNYVLLKLKITNRKKAQKIVRSIFLDQIDSLKKFQFEETEFWIKNIEKPVEIEECCKEAINELKSNIDFESNDYFQSTNRSIWVINYNQEGEFAQISLSSKLIPCIKYHPFGMYSYETNVDKIKEIERTKKSKR